MLHYILYLFGYYRYIHPQRRIQYRRVLVEQCKQQPFIVAANINSHESNRHGSSSLSSKLAMDQTLEPPHTKLQSTISCQQTSNTLMACHPISMAVLVIHLSMPFPSPSSQATLYNNQSPSTNAQNNITTICPPHQNFGYVMQQPRALSHDRVQNKILK